MRHDQIVRQLVRWNKAGASDPRDPHDWVRSMLGHGTFMCKRCAITDREAAALGRLNRCDAALRDGSA